MEIKVSNMNCKNCAAKIEKALVMNGIKPIINIENKTVTVKEQQKDKTIEVIKNTGYNPEV